MPQSLADLWQTKTTQSSALTGPWRGPDPSAMVRDALMGKPHTLAVDDPWSRERYPLIQFVREAWHVIEPRQFVEGWHIEALCLPFQSKIITEDGIQAIGDIVESQWSGRVLTWSHDAMIPEWKPITAWMQSPSRPLIKIRLSNGGEISLTENHPVFVVGEGYVNAGDLSVGDACLRVRILREDIQSSPKKPQSTLLKGMLSGRQGDNRTRKKFVDLPRMWKSLLSLPVSSLRRILQSRMFWQEQDSHRQKNMHTMWQDEKLWGWIFLQAMLGEVAIEGRVCAVSKLRQPCIPQPCTTQGIFSNIWSFLQSRVLRSFYERREQSGVYRWEISSRISRLIPAYAKAYFETRWYALLSLLIRWENGYSSYRQRQRQRQQRVVESCDALSFLSQSSKRDTRRNCEVVECAISSIERVIRIPETLYNLEVADNQNYFADTVLVHNCMHLEAVIRRDIKRLLINVPMRSGKSVLQSVLFPAWVWITDPAHKFLCTSYSKDLALRDSVRCRQLMLSSWYRERWGSRFRLQGDVNVKSRYANDKGGYRITSAVGGATGDGGDTLICIKKNQRILTENGYITIGEIVENQLDVRVASYSHEEKKVSWQRILRYYKRHISKDETVSPSSALYTINILSGSSLTLTGNHPVFTKQHGYIPASEIQKGDLVCNVWGTLPPTRVAVQPVQSNIFDERRPCAHCSGNASFLLKRMQGYMECGWEKSSQWAESNLCLRGVHHIFSRQTEEYWEANSFLLEEMPGHGVARSAVAWRSVYAMRNMREASTMLSVETGALQKSFLFEGLLPTNASGIAQSCESWRNIIPSRIFDFSQEDNTAERSALHALRNKRAAMSYALWMCSRCPSHRLRQEEQCTRQSCFSLPWMPCANAWEQASESNVDEAPTIMPFYETVASSTQRREETFVYNLAIDKNNNYFAEGVLVHNCDDLHSRNEDDSPSRADILAAVNFFNGDFAGCLTDPRDSAIIVSGQRIAVDDISADLLSKGDYVHLKIRQEYIPPPPGEEEPRTVIGWRDPRTQLGELMWPARWGPEQVAEAKRRGLRKYMAHHQQDPEGSGGTLFNDEWWRIFTQWPSLEIFRKIVQSWDMRFKDDKEDGSWVAGQVWGLAPNRTNVFLLDEVRGRWDFNETKEAFEALCQKWPTVRIKLIENKANGPAIYSALRAKTYGITLVEVDEGKFARGEKHTETAKSGQVWLPADTLVPWVADWRAEAKHYPSEPNDRIDAATQAWDHLLPRTFADDPRTEERERRRRRQALVKRVYQQQKITASRTGA